MSTRCNFGYLDLDGRVHAHYCHHDGYFAHVGDYLDGKVGTLAALMDLLAKGDTSVIGDDGYDEEGSHTAAVYGSLADYVKYLNTGGWDIEYAYLWDVARGGWLCAAGYYGWHLWAGLGVVMGHVRANKWGDPDEELYGKMVVINVDGSAAV